MTIVSSYNNNGLNDVLIVQMEKGARENQTVEKKGNVVRLQDKETGRTVGFNFFSITDHLSFPENGPVELNEEQIAVLNGLIKDSGWDDVLEADLSPKFVVGYVKECEPMEDSDHLSITQTEVDGGDVLQIVCGASNIAQGQKVVVAKEGAVMPDGTVIWSGELRGTPSFGMICSARELGLNVEGQQKGILVLPESEETGRPFTEWKN